MATAPRLSFWRRLVRPPLVFVVIVVVLAVIIAPFALLRQRGAPSTGAAANATCKPSPATVVGSAGNMKPDVVYQIVTDRFFDGDPSNNDPAGDTGLYDVSKAPRNSPNAYWQLYWGGDLKGITQKIPYIAGLGTTAIWISPPVENIHSLVAGQYAPYHGYSGIDYYRIDPHFGTWADFDQMVATAHQYGVKLIIDFVANHSNPRTDGDLGYLAKNGVQVTSYLHDDNGWYHHNADITSFNDQYNVEYGTLEGLSDFAHENPAVDAYLKGAIQQFLDHKVDGVRMDAVKHMPGPSGGWLRTFDDVVQSQSPHYIVGEWINDNPTTYQQSVRFANHSGMALLNFPMMFAIDKSIAGDDNNGTVGDFSFKPVDTTIQQQQKDFLWPNDQATFIDNHDRSRFLTLDPSHADLQEALAVLMTVPGIPIVYYGTEQYLYSTINGGGDPYNRPMMTSWDTTTPAYRLIGCLANLRHTNPALAYGGYHNLQVDKNTIVYERQFGQNVVLVAVNKNADTPATISNLTTQLPVGTYTDVLKGIQHGPGITVGASGQLQSFTLPKSSAGVWQFTAPPATSPLVGSVAPELVHPGVPLVIDGQGFGTSGTVQIDGTSAQVQQWSPNSITVTAPAIAGGYHKLQVCAGTCSGSYTIATATGPQVPVMFRVAGVPSATPDDQVYLTGALPELGSGKATTSDAIQLIHAPNDTTWFVQAAVPCQTFSYHYVIIHPDGTVTQAEPSEHTITPPCGTAITVNDTW